MPYICTWAAQQQVCYRTRVTSKSAPSRQGRCPAAFWATAGTADHCRESLPRWLDGGRRQPAVMVYTSSPAAASDMEDHEEMAAPPLEKAEATVLHPFAHQVGGHTQLMLLNHGTICKALIQRELQFYLNVPRDMRKFVPQYKGVIQIMRMDSTPSISHPMKLRKESAFDECEDKIKRVQKHQAFPELRVQIRACNDEKLAQPGYLHSHRKGSSDYSKPSSKYCLLLGNVASNFHKPCILDLKMGTRQHGDDATPDKRTRQMAKCAASTSARLGFRLCGMQVYQPNVDGFISKDKYYGRKLDERGVNGALYQFFHDGVQLQVNLIEKVLSRLAELRKSIEKQQTFRFYGSSLLLLYEGCPKREEDFLFEALEQSEDSCFEDVPSSMDDESSSFESSNDSTCASASLSWLASQNKHQSSLVCKARTCSVKHGPQVDVRMIDFAHTTHEGYDGDTTVHAGPDNGYLLGLDNLIGLLREVKLLSESSDRK